jgi:nicotinate-nucleotide pyrophosphorylase (carboxylating)
VWHWLLSGGVGDLVDRALAEDIGSGDVTTALVVPGTSRAHARIEQKEPGVIAGLETAREVFARLDGQLRWECLAPEGQWRDGGPVAEVDGPAAPLLAGERTALNLLGRLSGVATLTARYVAAVEGTGARILDTRKTTPGLRELEKAAVVAGGGVSHRLGLWDAVLIKENHAALAGGVGPAVRAAIEGAPEGMLVEVECRGPHELEEALAAGATRVLLDNMTPDRLREAVELTAGRAELEASGGITLDTVRAVAETGVDFISVGALTHSAPALDLSLVLEPR